MTDEPLTVYWGSGSPYAWRVMLALTAKKLEFRDQLLSFSAKEHRTSEYLRMNPRGKVPVLKVGNSLVLYESMAILAWLERAYPERPLFGRDNDECAAIWVRAVELDAYLQPAMLALALPIFFGRFEAERDAIAAALRTVTEEMSRFEIILEGHRWITGPRFSAADILLHPPLLTLWRVGQKPEAEELGIGVDPLAAYPNLSRHRAQLQALPGYERTFPPHWRS